MTFYGKGNQMPYLGSDEFRDWAYQQRKTDDANVSEIELRAFRPTIGQVTKAVTDQFDVDIDTIRDSQRGRVVENVPRWIVMHLAQDVCGLRLREIADYFGLKRTGSIPTTIAKLKTRMHSDRDLSKVVKSIRREYDT